MTAWGCALVALLEADALHAGQWMVSRPIVLGPLLGFLFGDAGLGLRLGALTELFCLDRAPLGSVIPLNASVAAGCAVLLCLGPQGLPEALAFPMGLAAGWGHTLLEARVRSWRGRLADEALGRLEAEGAVPWKSLFARSLGAHVGATALLLLCVTALAGPALAWLWKEGPGFLRDGLRGAYHIAAFPIGLSSLAAALWRQRLWT